MSEFLVLDTDRDLLGGLKGDKFKAIMEICFAEADHFSLSKWDRPSYPNYVEDMLEPYRIQSYKVEKWFAYNAGNPVVETIYEASEEALDIILKYYQDIFLNNTKKVPKKKYEQIGKQYLYPNILEDICFSKDKQMILGTLSHEYICAARCISPEFENKLQSLALWKKVNVDPFNMDSVHF